MRNIETGLLNILHGLNITIGNYLLSSVKNNITTMSRTAADFSFEEIDTMISNTEYYLGYVIGTLRNYFYSFYSSSMGYKALKDYDWLYVESLFKYKVVNELNYMMDNKSIYYRDFEPVLTNHIIPSSRLIYDQWKDVDRSIRYYFDFAFELIYNNNTLINQTTEELRDFKYNFVRNVEDLITSRFNIWYAYWEYFYNAQWAVLVEELREYQRDYNSFKRDYNNHVIVFNRLSESVRVNERNIDNLYAVLAEPISRFYNTKNIDPQLYWNELRMLDNIVMDFLTLDDISVRDSIADKIDFIFR